MSRTEPPSFDHESIFVLIERLRDAGFQVGTGQQIRAQNLLILLASRGHRLDITSGLRTWLAPVLCSSPAEQGSFYKLFDEWLDDLATARKKGRGGKRQEKLQGAFWEPIAQQKMVWVWVLLAALTVLLVIVFWDSLAALALAQAAPTGTGNQQTRIDAIVPSWAFGGTLGLITLAIGTWWFWKLQRGYRLVRWRTDNAPPLESLNVEGAGEQLFAGADFRSGLHQLRRHRQLASDDLDIDATVDATARSGGWFTPVYSPRRVTPEYLMMIDQAGFGDQQASLGEALFTRLAEEGVIVERYFFTADPRVCRKVDPREAHLVPEDLASLHSEHTLVIFSDGEGMLDPLTGGPAPWLDTFLRWPSRVLLTPLAQHLWGQREYKLGQAGFIVLPANGAGLSLLIEKIAASGPEGPEREGGWKPEFPEMLKQRPGRWLMDEEPPTEAVKKLIFQLRVFLGSEGFQWLCACAVYPELRWGLTLYLGHRLKNGGDIEGDLSRIVQLPWFRHAFMPDWLRLQLVSALDADQQEVVRQAFDDLFLSSLKGVSQWLELEILLRSENSLARRELGNKLLHKYVKNHPTSPLRDYVLLTFMAEHKTDQLSVGVPDRVINQLLPRARFKWFNYFFDALLLTLAYFILLATSIYGSWAGFAGGLVAAASMVAAVFRRHSWSTADIIQTLRAHVRPSVPKGSEIQGVVASHPTGLYVLFATELWERFSFYSMLALFTLYLQDKADGFGWERNDATSLYALYLMAVYFSPLVGGIIADRKLGYRRSVMIGGFFFMAGHLLLSFPIVWVMYLALVCLVVGNGFFKPNVSAMVGKLYPEGSHLKDRAYNIFYMGINVAAFLAPLVMEVVKQKFGYHLGFTIAAGGMVVSVATLALFKRHVEQADIVGRGGSASAVKGNEPKSSLVTEDLPPTATEVNEDELRRGGGAQTPGGMYVGASAAGDAARASALDAVPDSRRITALIVIFAIVVVFWMAFHQNGATWTYWANDNTDWGASAVVPILIGIFTLGLIDGSDVSGVISNAINPFFVIVLTFPLIWFWGWLDKKGKEPSTPTKMAIGMFLVAAAYMIMYQGAVSGGNTGRVSPWWLITAYGVITLGELMLSPMGLSLVSKVAPIRMRGLMMGGWFAATSIGNYLVGTIGVKWTTWTHSKFFFVVAVMCAAVGLLLFFLLRPLKKSMPGV